MIVPTRNEAGNIGLLVERIERALAGVATEIIFVDDSDDETPAAVARARRRSRATVRLVHRPKGDRSDGLGGAVVRGLREARADWVAVMDADLQHPPEVLPSMLAVAQEGTVDLIAASRFRAGGTAEHFGAVRSVLSQGSKAVARTLFPVRLRGVSDPMSGFFLVRRSAIDIDRLRPRGFKILVEILTRTPALRRAEIGFEFGTRHAGESKASLREGMRYLSQLAHARVGDRAERFVRYSAVGMTGLVVNMLVFGALIYALGLHYLVAAAIATQVSTGWNLLLTERLVFHRRRAQRSAGSRAMLFFAVNNAALLVRGPLLIVFVAGFGSGELLANFISLVALGIVRFGLADVWIWAGPDGQVRERPVFQYSVHGIVSVESPVRLRELERFRVDRLGERPTVRVHIGRLNRSQSELVTALSSVTRHTRYDEGLGRLGFAIEIANGRRTEVVASPLLAHSPHVLYTNVVEPILRWAFVKRGYALVHGACIAYGDHGMLVTAQTDTGKTTTVLRLLDRGGATFLSDDLTLITPDGRVLAYPKPMTVSRHTVAAVSTPLLTLRERLMLFYQSRVHSRSGRKFAFQITRTHLPVATINAIVQWLVPPPKYDVARLVPEVEFAQEARLGGLIVIERGGVGEEPLSAEAAAATLIANSEDAYGFPPYPSIARFLYQPNGTDLAAREREIVAAALARVPASVLRSRTMDWSERIPRVVNVHKDAPASQAAPAATLTAAQPLLAE